MICFFLLIFFLPVSATVVWEGESRDNPLFSATIQLSQQTVPLDETVRITLSTRHPEGFPPDRTRLRRHLLSTSPLKKPPFTLFEELQTTPSSTESTIEYTLIPQKTGTHLLTFYEIPFADKKTSLWSGTFSLTVTPITPPPLTFDSTAPQIYRFTPRPGAPARVILHKKRRTPQPLPPKTFPLPHALAATVWIAIAWIVRAQNTSPIRKNR